MLVVKCYPERILRSIVTVWLLPASIIIAFTTKVCAVCHEPLEQFWEEEEEEWHFKGSVRAPESFMLFHSNCYIDYTEVCIHTAGDYNYK